MLFLSEELSFYVSYFLVIALNPDRQIHTGIRMLHRQFKHGYVASKSEIGGQMEVNEKEFASFV